MGRDAPLRRTVDPGAPDATAAGIAEPGADGNTPVDLHNAMLCWLGNWVAGWVLVMGTTWAIIRALPH